MEIVWRRILDKAHGEALFRWPAPLKTCREVFRMSESCPMLPYWSPLFYRFSTLKHTNNQHLTVLTLTSIGSRYNECCHDSFEGTETGEWNDKWDEINMTIWLRWSCLLWLECETLRALRPLFPCHAPFFWRGNELICVLWAWFFD